MPHTPSIRLGQSSTPTQFDLQGYNSVTAQQRTSAIIGNPNIDQTINFVINGKMHTPKYTFPTDLPKYHFTLLENEWKAGEKLLTIDTVYKLPLPMGMKDDNEVNYDTNFNYLNILSQAASAVTGGLTQLGSQAARGVGAGLGLAVNNFKAVTLNSPDFRTFQFAWKFAPKSYKEAQEIQKIIYALKKAMHPRTLGETTRLFSSLNDTQADKLLLVFPKIFTMYFNPNIRYLYKFKPAVLSSLSVDYQGGQPAPSFYRAPSEYHITESPPESVIVAMNFIELEYWLSKDFKIGEDGLPTNHPFDAWNFYTYDPQQPEQRTPRQPSEVERRRQNGPFNPSEPG